MRPILYCNKDQRQPTLKKFLHDRKARENPKRFLSKSLLTGG